MSSSTSLHCTMHVSTKISCAGSFQEQYCYLLASSMVLTGNTSSLCHVDYLCQITLMRNESIRKLCRTVTARNQHVFSIACAQSLNIEYGLSVSNKVFIGDASSGNDDQLNLINFPNHEGFVCLMLNDASTLVCH